MRTARRVYSPRAFPIAAVAALILFGCIRTPTPRFAGGQAANLSQDGLRLVEFSGFQQAWVRPGTSFDDYKSIRLQYRKLAYREPPRSNQGPRNRSDSSDYPLTDDLYARLGREAVEVFTDEFDRDGLRLVEASGPGVLEARIHLVDLVVRWPLDLLGGQNNLYVDALGSVVVRIDLHDSASGELVARVVEFSEIASPSSRPIQVTAGSAIYETRQLMRSWAIRLRLFLQALQASDSRLRPHPSESSEDLGQAHRGLRKLV
jgi:hypothetical protein